PERAESCSESPEKKIGAGSSFRIVKLWERRSFRFWTTTKTSYLDRVGLRNPIEKK
ncbi:hypothetical protein A2U01_0116675, partial [Trifolium medium]|nr:hypothetical protein [Trifolium medium]